MSQLNIVNGLLSQEGQEGREGAKAGRKADAAARAELLNWQSLHSDTAEQRDNCVILAARLGLLRGQPMSVLQADSGLCNVDHDDRNCAAAVLAFEMRLRGFDVTAKPYDDMPGSVSFQLSEDTRIAWRTVKGLRPEFNALLKVGRTDLPVALDRITSSVGSRYHIGVNYDALRGHIVTAIRTSSHLVLYDPQCDEFISLAALL